MPPKRRRRFQGLYYHSSPPKVLPMNGQMADRNGRKRREIDDFSVKLSTIRIWMHEKEIGKLTRVLWAGQGNRLCQQASRNARMKRFLAAVPYVMNAIKEVHQAVVDNNLETLQAKLEPPVPQALVTAKDANGLNIIHKAAGLGHTKILEYLIGLWPEGANAVDITGKTALHWAASAKNNMRCYTILTEAGCDEEAVDYRMKSPSYYRHKPHEIERAFLVYIPEAPRVSPDVPTDWDALNEEITEAKKGDRKASQTTNASSSVRTTEGSIENTSELDLNDGSANGDDLSKDPEPESHMEEAKEPAVEEETEHNGNVGEEDQKMEEPEMTEDNTKADEEPMEVVEEAKATEQLVEENGESEGGKVEEETKIENEGEGGGEDPKDGVDEGEEKSPDHQNPIHTRSLNDSEIKDVEGCAKELEDQNGGHGESNGVNSEDETQDNGISKVLKDDNQPFVQTQDSDEAVVVLDSSHHSSEVVSDEQDFQNEIHYSEKDLENNDSNPAFERRNSNEILANALVVDETADSDIMLESHSSEMTLKNKNSLDSIGDQDCIFQNLQEVLNEIPQEDKDKVGNAENEGNLSNTDNVGNADNADKAGNADNLDNADNAKNADNHDNADTADNSKIADNADKSDKFDNEDNTDKSDKFDNEDNTDNADDLGHANNADITDKADTADKADIADVVDNGIDADDEDIVLESSQNVLKDLETSLDSNNSIGSFANVDKVIENILDTFRDSSPNTEKIDQETAALSRNEEATSFKTDDRTSPRNSLKKFYLNGTIEDNNNEDNNKDNDKDKKESGTALLIQNGSGDFEKNTSDDEIIMGKDNSIDGDGNESGDAHGDGGGVGGGSDDEAFEGEPDDEAHHDADDEGAAAAAPEAESNPDETGEENDDHGSHDVNDEDNDADKENYTDDAEEDSPSSSLAIEGFIQGDPEDNTVQSQIAAYVDEETRVQQIIASGDMEQLAQIVLNGDGNKLLNMQAKEPEVQAFLNNVPNYMDKIRRVHDAAREGNIVALQQALDRRKFAIAKDDISPNGATPLHVAVLFGHTDIVRYLSARFPETNSQTDGDGRTPLHYAATIKDNGHFFNMLVQNGANPKTTDKFQHTAEFYLEHETAKDILNYRQLLSLYGAEELEQEILNDQGKVENSSFETSPVFKTEQGKYLADTLADPLIEALTEIAQKRPENPLEYLTKYLQHKVENGTEDNDSQKSEKTESSSSKTTSTAFVNSNHSPGGKSLKNGHYKPFNDLEMDTLSINEEDEEEEEEMPNPSFEDRDEHGQSMLHFASARSHRKGGLMAIIEESKINITYRDELYRTARDVSLQANQPTNAKEIDRFVLSMAVAGDLEFFHHLAIEGYDHIIDVTDERGNPILDVVNDRGLNELEDLLKSLRSMEEAREELHHSIRVNDMDRIQEMLTDGNGKWLLKAKNYYGRTALHIAVLKENVEVVDFLVKYAPEILKIGDNLERTPLHYSMGTNVVESVSRILIHKGAKRTTKDLKGRQPSYYFMNKADILRLQEEEDENR